MLTPILLAACTSAQATTPAPVATPRPTALPDEVDTPAPGCVEILYAWVSTEEAIRQASAIVIGTVDDVSTPRSTGGVDYYEATVIVEQSIRGTYESGEPAIVTILGNCPDEGVIRAGERVLLLLEERAIGTQREPRITLYPWGKYLLTQQGQALNTFDSGRHTTLEQLLTVITEVPQGTVAGTVVPAPTGVVNPATITSLPSPTLLRGPTTITVNDLQMGQTLYLAVGDTFTLDSSVSGPIRIGDERVVAHATDAEGVYVAIATGQTELQVTHDVCASVPGCMAPVFLFILKIAVQ